MYLNGIIFWWNSSDSEEIFKTQKRIIMNSSKNASCWQLLKRPKIFFQLNPNIYSQNFYLLLKMKINFCLTYKYVKSTQGKFPICTYPQQTCQYTKKMFITQDLRSKIIYQHPLKIYLVIRINSN